MRRKTRRAVDEPGQDSFLDIVANLVGILIILIMIVGAQAKDAMVQAETPDTTPQVTSDDVDAERTALAAMQYELQRLDEQTRKQDIEIAFRREERDRILTLLAAAKATLQQLQAQLSDDQRDAHEFSSQLAAVREQLEDLKMAREAVQRGTPPVRVLTHRPTPLAQTVFGREVHFRLKDNRIAYVPIDELVEQFHAEAKHKAWKLRQAPAITETVGPIRDFRLKYTLKKSSFSVPTPAGSAVQEKVELDHFTLVPVRDDLGQPVDEALQPQSEFRSILATLNPRDVTVTVWVYPESFDAFRNLKENLFQLGFLTASRPMPEGMPIGGSPQGTRSAAQ